MGMRRVHPGGPQPAGQRVMGHERASTTLNRYAHALNDYSDRVLEAFDGFCCPWPHKRPMDALNGPEDDLRAVVERFQQKGRPPSGGKATRRSRECDQVPYRVVRRIGRAIEHDRAGLRGTTFADDPLTSCALRRTASDQP